jgi:hypothetical protein
VPHRTELRAVEVGVPAVDTRAAGEELAAIAQASGVPGRIVAERRVGGEGEAFIGFRAELGPVVVAGLGGVLVELTNTYRAASCRSPRTTLPPCSTSSPVTGCSADSAAPHPGAGQPSPRTVLGVAELGQRASEWIESIGVNPLICDEHACTAVDALLVLTDHPIEGT